MNSPIHQLAATMTEKFILAAPQQAARALETLATHEILQLVSGLKAQSLIVCFNAMDAEKAAAVVRRLPLRQASYVFARLQVPQAAKMMQFFSGPYRARISSVLEPAFLQMISRSASYAPGTVGALMQTEFFAVRTDMKLSQVIERLKNLPRKKIPSLCLVTDKDGILKGTVRSAELAFYSAGALAGSVMNLPVALLPQNTVEQACEVFKTQETDILPVTDEQGFCLGILRREELPPAKQSFWEKLTH